MSIKNLLYSALHFLLVAALIAASGLCIALGYDVSMRSWWQHRLAEHPDLFVKVGFALLALSLFLLYFFYRLNRGYYLQLKTAPSRPVSIDPVLIHQLVEKYYVQFFPDEGSVSDVQVRQGGVIEVFLTLSQPSEALLERVEKELGALFAKELKYEKEFILTVALNRPSKRGCKGGELF